jgi:hypothetical protein
MAKPVILIRYGSGCFVVRVSSARHLGEMLSLISKLLKQHMLEKDAAVTRQDRPKENALAAERISPRQLHDALVAVFPDFEQYWEDDENPHLEAGEFNHAEKALRPFLSSEAKAKSHA